MLTLGLFFAVHGLLHQQHRASWLICAVLSGGVARLFVIFHKKVNLSFRALKKKKKLQMLPEVGTYLHENSGLILPPLNCSYIFGRVGGTIIKFPIPEVYVTLKTIKAHITVCPLEYVFPRKISLLCF